MGSNEVTEKLWLKRISHLKIRRIRSPTLLWGPRPLVETVEGAPGSTSEPVDSPAPVEPVQEGQILVGKPWQTSIAPTYISLFLWLAYFDQLGKGTLASGGLLWCVMGAAAGGLLCYLLLYYAPAMWGQRTGQTTSVLATGTFGVRGAPWFVNLLVGSAQIIWMAISSYYATEWSLQGLVSLGLLSSQSLQSFSLGPVVLPSLLFLITSLAWLYAAALVGSSLVRIIIALMNVYPIFPAISLAVVVLMVLRNGGAPLPKGGAVQLDDPAGADAFKHVVQWVFGFFACSAIAAADWGATSRSTKDVRFGGLVGVFFSSWIVATLALLVVAVAVNPEMAPARPRNPVSAIDATFRSALLMGVPGWLAGITFILFGLAALAPTCYASFILGGRFSEVWPRWSRFRWILLATPLAWVLLILKVSTRLETIYTVMGALFSPVLAALAADYLRSRGEWKGPRSGINFPGVVAWGVGVVVGILPLVGEALGNPGLMRLQPASVLGFVAAYFTYLLLALAGGESPRLAVLDQGSPVASDDSSSALVVPSSSTALS